MTHSRVILFLAVDLSKQHPAPRPHAIEGPARRAAHPKEAACALMHQHQTRIAEATWPMKRKTCSLELAEHWAPPPSPPSPTLRASSSRMEHQPPCESKPARHTPELMTSALARVWARCGAQLQSRACGAAPRVSWLTHLPHPARPFLHRRGPAALPAHLRTRPVAVAGDRAHLPPISRRAPRCRAMRLCSPLLASARLCSPLLASARLSGGRRPRKLTDWPPPFAAVDPRPSFECVGCCGRSLPSSS